MVRKLVSILALLLALTQALAQEDQDVFEEMEEQFDILDDLEENQETGEELDITTRILEANQYISGLLTEGDIAFPRKRNALKCTGNRDCKWPKLPSGLVEVPYRISDYYSSAKTAIIKKAMEYFHAKTCIRFVPQTYQLDFIDIVSKEGCWSMMGKTGYRQFVSLQSYGCVYHGIVQHELLHALGFYHEHTRSDRDQHVRINWHYIAGGTHNFEKVDSNNLNTPYDYSSIMHYDRYAFSTTYGRPTITPIPNAGVAIGQRSGLSELDILKVNRLYECDMPK